MAIKLISILVYLIMIFLRLTCRVRYVNPEVLSQCTQNKPSPAVCFALWHQNAASSILSHLHLPLYPMVSRSKDGEIVATVFRWLGLGSARGSSSRGGKEAKLELLHVAGASAYPSFTIDGPRGPRHKVKRGVIDVASQTSLPIVPITAVANKNWIFSKSWDQTKLAKPFSKILVIYGTPLDIPGEITKAEVEGFAEKIKVSLTLNEEQIASDFDSLWEKSKMIRLESKC